MRILDSAFIVKFSDVHCTAAKEKRREEKEIKLLKTAEKQLDKEVTRIY